MHTKFVNVHYLNSMSVNCQKQMQYKLSCPFIPTFVLSCAFSKISFLFRCIRFWCSPCLDGFLCPYTQHTAASDTVSVCKKCYSFDVVRQNILYTLSFLSTVEPLGLHYRIEGAKANVVLYRRAIPINFMQFKLRTLWDPVILRVWTALH
jgi:hypothetical protein